MTRGTQTARDRVRRLYKSAVFAVAACCSLPAFAQLIHAYETPSSQVLGLALPALCIAASLWFLAARARSRGLAVRLALFMATFIGLCVLLVYTTDGAGFFAFFALLACPWPLAIIAMLVALWSVAAQRDAERSERRRALERQHRAEP